MAKSLAARMHVSGKIIGGTAERREPWELTHKEYDDILDYQPQGQSQIPKSLVKFIPGDKAMRAFQKEHPDLVNNDWYNNHRYFVAKALVDGKSVPASVLAEYPDLAGKSVKASTKEPWQMTEKEWDNLSSEQKQSYSYQQSGIQPYHSNFHLMSVIDALKAGKDVPETVIVSFGKNTGIEHALTKKATKAEPTVSAIDASEAGRELSQYGRQKTKYKVTSHKSNKSNKPKSRRNSTAGIGSVR